MLMLTSIGIVIILTFTCALIGKNYSVIILIFYCIFLFSICFLSLSFCKIAPINFVIVSFAKKINGIALLKTAMSQSGE